MSADKELSDAILANDLAKVGQLLKANPALVRSSTAAYTPLHRYCCFEIIILLFFYYFIIILLLVLLFVDSFQLFN